MLHNIYVGPHILTRWIYNLPYVIHTLPYVVVCSPYHNIPKDIHNISYVMYLAFP